MNVWKLKVICVVLIVLCLAGIGEGVKADTASIVFSGETGFEIAVEESLGFEGLMPGDLREQEIWIESRVDYDIEVYLEVLDDSAERSAWMDCLDLELVQNGEALEVGAGSEPVPLGVLRGRGSDEKLEIRLRAGLGETVRNEAQGQSSEVRWRLFAEERAAAETEKSDPAPIPKAGESTVVAGVYMLLVGILLVASAVVRQKNTE